MLSDDLKKFIGQHADDDPVKLVLQQKKYPSVDLKFAAQQIEGRQKSRGKLPELSENDDFIFPPKLNLEQCSSEATARYKAQAFIKGKTVADITGGLGIDAIYFSKVAKKVFYVERNPELFEIAVHNFKALNIGNIEACCGDGIEFLKTESPCLDLIYTDPARRDMYNRKMVSLSDCQPDVLENRKIIFSKARQLLVKASPMLDLSLVKRELDSVSEITVLAVKNECKELLVLCDTASTAAEVAVHCINFTAHGEKMLFTSVPENESQIPEFSVEVKKYLYDPNAAISKAGFFNALANRFHLLKLGRRTHLYTSDDLVGDFPGRVFEVLQEVRLSAKEIRTALPDGRAHVVTRNYPVPAEDLRKKLRLSEGTDKYVVAATLHGGKKAGFLCKKIM